MTHNPNCAKNKPCDDDNCIPDVHTCTCPTIEEKHLKCLCSKSFNDPKCFPPPQATQEKCKCKTDVDQECYADHSPQEKNLDEEVANYYAWMTTTNNFAPDIRIKAWQDFIRQIEAQAKRQEGVRILEGAKGKSYVEEDGNGNKFEPQITLSDLTNIINNHD